MVVGLFCILTGWWIHKPTYELHRTKYTQTQMSTVKLGESEQESILY